MSNGYFDERRWGKDSLNSFAIKTNKIRLVCHFLVLTTFWFCDLLLSRRKATWNLLNRPCKGEKESSYSSLYHIQQSRAVSAKQFAYIISVLHNLMGARLWCKEDSLLVVSNLPRASSTRYTKANHEPIVLYLGPVSQKSRRLFGPEKPFVKLRPSHSVKLIFSYVVKGIKIKITAKFHVTEHLRFEDTKRIMSPEKFRDFGETGPWPELLEAQLALTLTTTETIRFQRFLTNG